MPFAGFKDFADCVRKNKNKRNPEAFCGAIKARVEGKNTRKRKSMRESK